MTHSVLMLGAGFVTRPTLDALSKAGVSVTVACRTLATAQKLSAGVPNARPIALDVADDASLDSELAGHDLVISLVPYTLHPAVIRAAIRARKHVVTTSYVAPAIAELDQACRDAGITVMNEIGCDPGIDNLYAVKTIEEVHAAGGKIRAFQSYCGGLPAPEASGNPLGYKFSWSSRGSLLTLVNDAKWIQDGAEAVIRGKDLMATARPYVVYPGFAFVAFPNRDSTPYREKYGIPEARTVVRGSLRYQGFPQLARALFDLGFLDQAEHPALGTTAVAWREATRAVIGAPSSLSGTDDLEAAVRARVAAGSDEERDRIVAGLRWIGLFSDEPVAVRASPLDTLCATLERKMQYGEGERDMVMLQHRFEIEHADGTPEVRTLTLCEYGDPAPGGYSAMARLVGLPCAVAVQQILDGTIVDRGVLAPVSGRINEPLMRELKEKYGISMVEETVA